ncbi:hypothetical protein [Dyadobacter sp. CY323]|uniref:hypothetical protein n=1 Tax=Dyadobacter sp. CY323 TaxID=2907302 RepID=UPI001F25AFF0|nr:hypothetical protein [Dyadobacter sp. CY323]MCE6988475.1 hypothetical protein [Dyadobacter sp. CY323]
MKNFSSIEQAFEWWLTNIYPSLPAEIKKGKLTYAWRDFTYNRGISHTRMKEILSEYGEIEIQTLIKYIPK